MASERKYQTRSGIPLQASYGPEDVPDLLQRGGVARPGVAPFLRGAYPGMYRTKPWRIFQLSGYGNPEDERARIQFLLSQGETGFIMEHDRNTADHLYNVDHPQVTARKHDVGLTGAVIQSIRDFETVLDGIPIDRLYGHPGGGVVQHAPFALGCYWALARRRGFDLRALSGTGQSDYFLTYLGCVTKQQVPTQVGLRLNADIIEFCGEHMPRWVPVSIAAYNGAETGLNASQELGALFANAVEYLDEVKRRGRVPIEVAARGVAGVSFRVSMDFFEDAAKLRAARKMWYDLVRSRYGIEDDRASRLRIHIVTAGSAMTYRQPLNNIVRATVMALGAVLGGTQSLGVSGYDEALSVPSEHAHQMSLRIQQILQHETNLCAVADPLGGSYYVENLTSQLEERGWEFFEAIQGQGGFLAALDSGWLHDRAHENQRAEMEAQSDGSQVVVGVSRYGEDVCPYEIDGFIGVSDAWERAAERLAELKKTRNETHAGTALRSLAAVCRGEANVMPAMMDAVDADVSLGEIGDLFREVFGDWETPIAT